MHLTIELGPRYAAIMEQALQGLGIFLAILTGLVICWLAAKIR